MTPGLGAVFALLCVLGAVTGFRDAPNAVALPVRHRALSPHVALVMAALLNGVGVVLGMGLMTLAVDAYTRSAVPGSTGLLTLATAILVAVAWGVLLWWRRVPGSMTHAVLAALAGGQLAAHLALGQPLDAHLAQMVRGEVVVSLLASPVLAWGLSRLLTVPTVRLGTTGTTVNVQNRARISLAVSGGAAAVGHGVQTGQRLGTLWAVALAGTGTPWAAGDRPAGLLAAAGVLAAAVALGTLGGAWRIAWTLTERLVDLDPLRASVAAAVPAALLFVDSLVLHLPLSSTHTATAAIVGAGQTQSYASVRWAHVARVAAWWVLTPVACAGTTLLLALAVLPVA